MITLPHTEYSSDWDTYKGKRTVFFVFTIYIKINVSIKKWDFWPRLNKNLGSGYFEKLQSYIRVDTLQLFIMELLSPIYPLATHSR